MVVAVYPIGVSRIVLAVVEDFRICASQPSGCAVPEIGRAEAGKVLG
jgi:hypothetical protein